MWAKGFALFKAKQYPESILALKEGLSFLPEDEEINSEAASKAEIKCKIQNVLGNVYFTLEKFVECERSLEATISLCQKTGLNPLGSKKRR